MSSECFELGNSCVSDEYPMCAKTPRGVHDSANGDVSALMGDSVARDHFKAG